MKTSSTTAEIRAFTDALNERPMRKALQQCIEINSRTELMLFWVIAPAKRYLMVTFLMSSWLDHHNCFFESTAFLMPIMDRFSMTGLLHYKLELHHECFDANIIPMVWHVTIVSVGSNVPQWVIFSIICTLLFVFSTRNWEWVSNKH